MPSLDVQTQPAFTMGLGHLEGQSHPFQHKHPEEIHVTPRRELGQNENASEPGQQGTTEQLPTSPESGIRKRKTRGTASHAATHLVRRAQEEEEVSRQRATLPMLVV